MHLTFQKLDLMEDFAEMKRILDAGDDRSSAFLKWHMNMKNTSHAGYEWKYLKQGHS